MQTHVPLVKYAPTLDQQMNSSSLQTAACENVFQTERENIYLDLQKKKKEANACYCPIVLPSHKVTAIHFQESSSGARTLCRLACFSVIAHRCRLCARAPNNGLSWSCSTCFAEAFKSFSLQKLLHHISVTNP